MQTHINAKIRSGDRSVFHCSNGAERPRQITHKRELLLEGGTRDTLLEIVQFLDFASRKREGLGKSRYRLQPLKPLVEVVQNKGGSGARGCAGSSTTPPPHTVDMGRAGLPFGLLSHNQPVPNQLRGSVRAGSGHSRGAGQLWT